MSVTSAQAVFEHIPYQMFVVVFRLFLLLPPKIYPAMRWYKYIYIYVYNVLKQKILLQWSFLCKVTETQIFPMLPAIYKAMPLPVLFVGV